MCETGRDCSPLAIGALIFQMIAGLMYLFAYVHHHVTYGVLSEFQHCGYIIIYFIVLLDIVGGVLGIMALRNFWPSNYSNYTPAMMCLLLASCFNCFVYVAFKSTLDINEMKEYLAVYILTNREPPGILQDLQKNRHCCGIFNYTDYPVGKVPDSCCRYKNCAKNISNYQHRLGCVQPNIGSDNPQSRIIKLTTKGYSIIWAPYVLLLLRAVVIGIYRCGMLDNIASGIPVVIHPKTPRHVSESNVVINTRGVYKYLETEGQRPLSMGNKKYSVISPHVTSVPEPQPHVVVQPPLVVREIFQGKPKKHKK